MSRTRKSSTRTFSLDSQTTVDAATSICDRIGYLSAANVVNWVMNLALASIFDNMLYLLLGRRLMPDVNLPLSGPVAQAFSFWTSLLTLLEIRSGSST